MKMNFKINKQIDFMKQAKYLAVLSIVALVVSVASIFTKGMDYGIDFAGGVLMEVQADEVIDMAQMRQKMDALNLGEVSLQSVGTQGTEMLIHVLVDTSDKSAQETVIASVKETLGDGIEYRRTEVVGPKVGDELKEKSIIASLFALLAIAIYIWFRFEWQFSVACLLAVAFDLIVTVGLFSLTGLDFNMTVVAGLLSLAGYTTNDKVVNFDRIRENLKLYRKMPIPELLNKSVNDTLSRTILTSITTMMMLIILIFMGGETLFGFSVCLLVGIILGTYSSIYIAVPLLQLFDLRNVGREDETGPYAEAAKYEREAKKAPLDPMACRGCGSCKK